MMAVLLCPEKSTVTNVICTAGRQQEDWSAHYRLYSQARVDESVLFATALEEVQAALDPQAALVIAMDDTLTRKSGAHIDGVAWRRDPLGPPFQTNLVRGQRFVQFSAAWPLENGQARLVPIGFFHAPPARKPGKNATAAQLATYREEQKQKTLNRQALAQMHRLREQCESTRRLIFGGDGSYTNGTILKNLPANSVYLGRVRKDAKLHYLPQKEEAARTGRRRGYGKEAPTPEELRTNESIPWQDVEAFAAGQRHTFRVKVLRSVLWRKSGAQLPLMVMVIAPLGYRLRKGSRLLYRQPAYLIGTDPQMAVEEFLQDYLWRWGIEVNFREEKTLIGAGEAHVRTPSSNQHLPAVIVAAYALLWVSALKVRKRGLHLPGLQPPKWRQRCRPPTQLFSTGDLLRALRFETWSRALRPDSFYHFMTHSKSSTKPEKLSPSLPSALFNAA
jgi:DDE superfamily endonuclease